MREHTSDDPSQAQYEEWIYGTVPKTIKFIRFTGDRVTQVKIAALGKAIEIRDKDEMASYRPAEAQHEVLVGDARDGEEKVHATPPTLRKEGEPAESVPNGMNRVQFPDAKPVDPVAVSTADSKLPSSPAPPGTGKPVEPLL